jgi:acyl transferase domain-containing protein
MEVEAISRVFHHKSGRPTLVGGVKPSLGHSEAASGLSSIIKMTLALERGIIPATVGVKNVNPRIKTQEWNINIVKENLAWPETCIRRASVNSFGFGGANAHAILEAATTSLPKEKGRLVNGNAVHEITNGDVVAEAVISLSTNGDVERTNGAAHIHVEEAAVSAVNGVPNGVELPQAAPQLLTFSARSQYSLSRMVQQLATYVSSVEQNINVNDLAFTLNCRRSGLTHRGFLLASSSTLQSDLDPHALVMSETNLSSVSSLKFIFTGQGAQWAGMGRELLSQYAVFRNSIDYLDTCLRSLEERQLAPSWTIRDTLLAPAGESDINSAEKSQPICTAVQVALTDLLRDWNILPDTVIGHSSGEIAAAYAAGFLTAKQAILAAYCRGQAVTKNAQNGAMMAIGLGSVEAQKVVDELELGAQLTVACHNSPESSTISGNEDAIEHMFAVLQERKVFSRKLKTGGKAYHSHQMKALGPMYQELLEEVATFDQQKSSNGLTNGDVDHVNSSSTEKDSSVKMISTVTGQRVAAKLVATPTYWRMNLESPVLFEEAIRVATATETCHFVEVGPHSALELPIKQTSTASGKGGDLRYTSALVRGKDASRTILQLVGSLFLRGHDEINYKDTVEEESHVSYDKELRILTDLPPYPWDYTAGIFWHEPRVSRELREQKFTRHDLLGSQVTGGNGLTWSWRNILDVNEVTWLRDHCLGPSIVFPAAAYIAMAIEAASQLAGYKLEDCPGVELRNLNFLRTLDLHPDHKPKVELLFQMKQHMLSSVNVSSQWWEFTVVTLSLSTEDSQPTTHVRGLVGIKPRPDAMRREIKLDKDGMEQHATRIWYEKFTKEGLNWGPQFAVMQEIFCDRARLGHYAGATVPLLRGDTVGVERRPQYIAHPIIIDSMLQAAFVATTAGWVRELRATVPVTIDSISVAAPSKLDMDTIKPWSIDSVSDRVGFGTVKIDTELYNTQDQVLFRMKGVRCVAYHGNVQSEAPEQRHPLVRTVWKPDYTTFAAGANRGLSHYIDRFAEICTEKELYVDANELRLAGALDLVVHKKPNVRILELGGSTPLTQAMMVTLRVDSSLRRFEKYTKGYINDESVLLGYDILHIDDLDGEDASKAAPISGDEKFDVIIFGSVGYFFFFSRTAHNTNQCV